MNFLELAVNLRIECSVAGVGPITISDNRAEYQRLIKWIREANVEIQGKYANWRFLWHRDQYITVPGQSYYLVNELLSDNINLYRPDSFKINGCKLADTDFFNPNIVFDETAHGTPTAVIIQPDNSQKLWPIPDTDDSVTYEYYQQPQQLIEAEDNPLIPEPWHKLIIYRAMMMYGDYENAPEVKQAGVEGLSSIMPQLEANQLPGQRDSSLSNEYDIVVSPE